MVCGDVGIGDDDGSHGDACDEEDEETHVDRLTVSNT